MSRSLNWTDLLDQDLDYVVLRKNNRLQVLYRPDHKQLRRRGKRNWSLVAAIASTAKGNGDAALPHELREAVLQALLELTSTETVPAKKAKKPKKARA
jgi:hypothetical protein